MHHLANGTLTSSNTISTRLFQSSELVVGLTHYGIPGVVSEWQMHKPQGARHGGAEPAVPKVLHAQTISRTLLLVLFTVPL